MNQHAKTVGMVLAGGKGSRLNPLTAKRTKPAVPFGSKYRIIDFALNNLINSGIYGMYVLTQFKAQSLTEHIQRYWRFGSFLSDHFITLAPAQMYLYEELGAEWYRGTADAIYQNLHLVDREDVELVAIFSGDHIYKMDIAHMIAYHREKDADVTISAYPTAIEDASRFGILQVDDDYAITDFQEKPAAPKPMPGDPTRALASMGNYLFSREALFDMLQTDADDPQSEHDFGKDVLPRALHDGQRLMAYDFERNPIPGQDGPNTYWRDVGTLDAYHAANMDLVRVQPEFDLYNDAWPLRTSAEFSPPAKFVHEEAGRTGQAFNSLLAGGVIVSGATVRDSVVSRRVRVHSHAVVERCVLLDGVEVGRGSHLRNVIVDKNVVVPEGTHLGFDRAADEALGLTVSAGGVVAVPKGYRFPGPTPK